ncbi:MAG: hypothetical protein LIO60_06510 [Oscillospiraceae bacterium]|nr:hypothetical protein [Oscillospiraceae bacterium]
MRRGREGYALLGVLAAVLLLCAVATALCGASARELRAQQNAVEQLQARCTAEGQLVRYRARAAALGAAAAAEFLPETLGVTGVAAAVTADGILVESRAGDVQICAVLETTDTADGKIAVTGAYLAYTVTADGAA